MNLAPTQARRSAPEPADPLTPNAPRPRIDPVVDLVPSHTENGGILQRLGRLAALGSPLPYGVWRHRSPEYTARLSRHLANDKFDLLLCDGVYDIQNLPDQLSLPILRNKDEEIPGRVARLRVEKHYSFTVHQSALRSALGELGL